MIALTYVRCKVARHLVIQELQAGLVLPHASLVLPHWGKKRPTQFFFYFSQIVATLFSKNVDMALGAQWNNTTCGAFKAF